MVVQAKARRRFLAEIGTDAEQLLDLVRGMRMYRDARVSDLTTDGPEENDFHF